MTRNESVERIGKQTLGLPTMKTRNSDGLDFHDLSVWQIREALNQAYDDGYDAGSDAAKGKVK